MKVTIKGEGEVIIRFINNQGHTLIDRSLVVTGSPTVTAIVDVPLEVETEAGSVPLIPVLANCDRSRQTITFDNLEPTVFSKRCCNDMGCSSAVVEIVESGRVQGLDTQQTDSMAMYEREIEQLCDRK